MFTPKLAKTMGPYQGKANAIVLHLGMVSPHGPPFSKIVESTWYISHNNIHEINTRKRSIQTQCGPGTWDMEAGTWDMASPTPGETEGPVEWLMTGGSLHLDSDTHRPGWNG